MGGFYFLSCAGSSGIERERSPSQAGQISAQNPSSPSDQDVEGNPGAFGEGDAQIIPQSNNNNTGTNDNSLADLTRQAQDLLNALSNSSNNNSSSQDDDDEVLDDGGEDSGKNSSSSKGVSTIAFRFSDFDVSNRAKYFFTTTLNGPVQGDSPHGKVRIFYTLNVEDFINKKDFQVPTGTMAVKEFDQNGDGKIDGLAIMIKQQAGYDPDGQDWSYEVKNNWGATVDGQIGIVATCKSCHGSGEGKKYDYLKGLQKAAGE